MKVVAYRLVKQKYRDTAFDGEGARLYGGRWNSPGRACVYLTSSESLAMLEVMAHLQDYQLLSQYALYLLALPSALVSQISSDCLPDNWRDMPAPPETAEMGDEWLASNVSLALALPSVVVPREINYLLNPNHPEFDTIVHAAIELPFTPDPRL
ncbi:RES family NAD+ phosphorylase [uncultured Kushneria sp.]|uniref:RES family NAD+ phosphorylase n=1 Tax=uncultured Kushneria sp. TaxID=905033 RepID=UPI00261981E6|nr:RES family NAD+ phosphorylase [uncultured Kushneria sp.]